MRKRTTGKQLLKDWRVSGFGQNFTREKGSRDQLHNNVSIFNSTEPYT